MTSPEPQIDRLLTYREAALVLRVPEVEILRLLAHGRLTTVWIARSPRIRSHNSKL